MIRMSGITAAGRRVGCCVRGGARHVVGGRHPLRIIENPCIDIARDCRDSSPSPPDSGPGLAMHAGMTHFRSIWTFAALAGLRTHAYAERGSLRGG